MSLNLSQIYIYIVLEEILSCNPFLTSPKLIYRIQYLQRILFFQTVLILVLYWKEKKDGEFSAGRFPAFRNIRENGGVYALPSLEYPRHAKVRDIYEVLHY